MSSAGVDPVRLIEKDPAVACEDLVAQCFIDEQAPLAVPELNRESTLRRAAFEASSGCPTSLPIRRSRHLTAWIWLAQSGNDR